MTENTTNDPIMQTRVDVAEMKGMLTTLVSSHSQRLDSAERRLDNHDARLNEKRGTIARHDERIQDLEDDSTARWGRTTGVIALIGTALTIIVSVLSNFPL